MRMNNAVTDEFQPENTMENIRTVLEMFARRNRKFMDMTKRVKFFFEQ